MREAYRLNKLQLLKLFTEEESPVIDTRIRILISLSNSAYSAHGKLKFRNIEESMPFLLSKIIDNFSA